MQAIRKITNNLDDITIAREAAIRVEQEYASQHPSLKPVINIPRATFDEHTYNFRLCNFQSYYLEDRDGTIDIIALLNGEGLVRFKYDPLLINQFDLYLSLQA